MTLALDLALALALTQTLTRPQFLTSALTLAVNLSDQNPNSTQHPNLNPGCMHDDHSLRANWQLPEWEDDGDAPVINILDFPCNMPATGCNDTIYEGPPGSLGMGDMLPTMTMTMGRDRSNSVISCDPLSN